MKNILIAIVSAIIALSAVREAAAHPAWGIVVDSQGQVYFSDLETVWKIDTRGKVAVFRAGLRGRHVHDLTIDAEDNIYGIDNSYNPQTQTFPRAVWKMSANGEFSYLVPMTDNLPPGQSIWRDDENTYSVEPYNNEKKECKIIKRFADGKARLFAGGKYGFLDGRKDKAEFSRITDMAFGADQAIYVTDEDKVRKIDRAGMVTTIYPRGNADQKRKASSRLFGIAVDAQNNVFVADPGNRRIVKIAAGGEVSTAISAEQPWQLNGVALSGGDVYILESWFDESETKTGTRVRKLSADGKTVVPAIVGDKPDQSANANPVLENKMETSTAGGNPAVEEIKTNVANPKGLPYILIGAGFGVITAASLIRSKRRRLFS